MDLTGSKVTHNIVNSALSTLNIGRVYHKLTVSGTFCLSNLIWIASMEPKSSYSKVERKYILKDISWYNLVY